MQMLGCYPMYAPQGTLRCSSSVLASSVIIVAAGACLLPPLRLIKKFPLFCPTMAKTRENGAFYGSRPAENAGKSMGFRDSDIHLG